MKLSFKNHHPEGRYRSFGHINVDIKVDGAIVGSIGYSSDNNAMYILLHVKTETGFRNAILKQKFPISFAERVAINEAKAWLKEHWASISKLYDLHTLT